MYEYQASLNPLRDDSAKDTDGDGLSNLVECEFGSWAHLNDREGDGMDDFYEFQMGLNASDDDSTLDLDNDNLTNIQEYLYKSWANDSDTDNDGITDDWEFRYDLDATDPTDAGLDPDGDRIINIDEYKAGTDPHNFFSFPLLSFNAFYQTIAVLIIVISIISFSFVKGYLLIQERRKKALIIQFNAPDYPTAVKIQQLKLNNYAELQRDK